mgnify:CR=1 FL=1
MTPVTELLTVCHDCQPPVMGTAAFRAPRAFDAPNNIPQFGALSHEYYAMLQTRPTDPLPGVRYDAKEHQRSLEMMRWGLGPF